MDKSGIARPGGDASQCLQAYRSGHRPFGCRTSDVPDNRTSYDRPNVRHREHAADDRPNDRAIPQTEMMPLDRAGRSIALKFFALSDLRGAPRSGDQVCSVRRRISRRQLAPRQYCRGRRASRLARQKEAARAPRGDGDIHVVAATARLVTLLEKCARSRSYRAAVDSPL